MRNCWAISRAPRSTKPSRTPRTWCKRKWSPLPAAWTSGPFATCSGDKMPRIDAHYTESLRRLMDMLARLPGVGSRSAERMAFHLLKNSKEEALALSEAIRAVKEQVRHCSICFNLTETDPCSICSDPGRDQGIICVVEQPK